MFVLTDRVDCHRPYSKTYYYFDRRLTPLPYCILRVHPNCLKWLSPKTINMIYVSHIPLGFHCLLPLICCSNVKSPEVKANRTVKMCLAGLTPMALTYPILHLISADEGNEARRKDLIWPYNE